MTGSMPGSEIIGEAVRTHYDVGQVETPTPLPHAHQRRHRKLVTHTDVGSFLVKTYPADPVVLDALRFQHRLSRHLAVRDLPVARIQPARNGKLIVEIGNWAMELQEFIEGEPLPITWETLAVAGDALGRFHEVCRDLPRPDRDARRWRFSDAPRRMFAGLFTRAQEEGDAAAAIDACNRIALFLHEAAKELGLEQRSQFETGVIHGDWHVGNLLWADGRLRAIVDLEFAGDGCFLEDLAYGLSNLCVRTTTDPERLGRRLGTLLKHYQAHRRISYYEERAMYYAVGIKHVATVSYQLPQLGGKVAGMTASEWMATLAAQCAWLEEQAHGVRQGMR